MLRKKYQRQSVWRTLENPPKDRTSPAGPRYRIWLGAVWRGKGGEQQAVARTVFFLRSARKSAGGKTLGNPLRPRRSWASLLCHGRAWLGNHVRYPPVVFRTMEKSFFFRTMEILKPLSSGTMEVLLKLGCPPLYTCHHSQTTPHLGK